MMRTLLALAFLPIAMCAWAEDNARAFAEYPYKNTPAAQNYRGSIVFQYYCALCHGSKGDGDGRAAKLYTPKPANLVMSERNDDYKELIIRRGGGPIGRSSFMPPWGNELTDEQISDVIAYLRSIRSPSVVVK
jgi:mono/diheme cytochrome c family protein